MILTPREKNVMQRVARGLTSKAIGTDLGLSHKTINVYRQRLHLKLGSHNTAEMMNEARKRGLIR